jgi:beta-mannosidase
VAVARSVIVATGLRCGEAFHFPGGLPSAQVSDLGLEATADPIEGGAFRVTLRTRRLLQSVAIDARGFRADDAYFHVAPGGERQITLRPVPGVKAPAKLAGTVFPLNAQSPVKIALRGSP